MKDPNVQKEWAEKESAIVSLVAIAQTGDPKEVLETAVATVVDSYTTRTLASHNNSLVERLEDFKRMESDYDDEDKRARRDVRPYNEGIAEAQDLIKNSLTKHTPSV